jgi:hypothetical protein
MRERQEGARQAAQAAAEPPVALVARLVPAEYLGQMPVWTLVLRMPAAQTRLVELLAAPELVALVAEVARAVLFLSA